MNPPFCSLVHMNIVGWLNIAQMIISNSEVQITMKPLKSFNNAQICVAQKKTKKLGAQL